MTETRPGLNNSCNYSLAFALTCTEFHVIEVYCSITTPAKLLIAQHAVCCRDSQTQSSVSPHFRHSLYCSKGLQTRLEQAVKGILQHHFAQVWLTQWRWESKSDWTERMAQGCCVLMVWFEHCGLVVFCGCHHTHRLSSISKNKIR